MSFNFSVVSKFIVTKAVKGLENVEDFLNK